MNDVSLTDIHDTAANRGWGDIVDGHETEVLEAIGAGPVAGHLIDHAPSCPGCVHAHVCGHYQHTRRLLGEIFDYLLKATLPLGDTHGACNLLWSMPLVAFGMTCRHYQPKPTSDPEANPEAASDDQGKDTSNDR